MDTVDDTGHKGGGNGGDDYGSRDTEWFGNVLGTWTDIFALFILVDFPTENGSNASPLLLFVCARKRDTHTHILLTPVGTTWVVYYAVVGMPAVRQYNYVNYSGTS